MPAIHLDSLLTLEAYAKARPAFRREVMAHKKRRSVQLGEHLTLIFEDELTIRYQVQEMLRIEKIFDEEGILHELEAYNPLVPDGTNLKATLMIEFPDIDERRTWLARLIGIEDRVWVKVAKFDPVFAIADEDLDRETAEKTSSVHFLRFELTREMCRSLKQGAAIAIGVDHPAYSVAMDPVAADVRDALANDIL